ncbi:MAG TPA: alpha/beta hydrolase [Acetobacteraceae bacterium]|nr:alpha/beta hydrolase [Acetobacteraceae bacterium]
MSTTLDADSKIEDIEYRPGLLARLYRPAGNGPFPAIVEVHGGAWVNSDRQNNAPLAETLASEGIMTLSLDFRMPPEAGYPASLQDINYGVRWLKSRAGAFGARPERVGLFGTSSGGHQVLLAAMRPFDARYAAHALPDAPDIDARVAFVVSAWGVLCPLERYGIAKAQGNATVLDAHHRFWGTEAAMAEGSPPSILERGETVETPPAWVFQGDADEWVPNALAERFAAGWRKAGGEIDLTLFPGEKHTFMRNHPDSPNSRRALEMLLAFIRRHG